jgi:hypothetical protein
MVRRAGCARAGAHRVTEDLVDVHFRPFVRALGNLVIAFAVCENELLRLVAAMLGADELQAVAVLKKEDAKDRVIALARGLDLAASDLVDLVSGIEGFWQDKEIRNRLIHDEWYPSLLKPGTIKTRGVTRAKKPEVLFHDRTVEEVWALAARFQAYDGLFSHRSWAISRRGA